MFGNIWFNQLAGCCQHTNRFNMMGVISNPIRKRLEVNSFVFFIESQCFLSSSPFNEHSITIHRIESEYIVTSRVDREIQRVEWWWWGGHRVEGIHVTVVWIDGQKKGGGEDEREEKEFDNLIASYTDNQPELRMPLNDFLILSTIYDQWGRRKKRWETPKRNQWMKGQRHDPNNFRRRPATAR